MFTRPFTNPLKLSSRRKSLKKIKEGLIEPIPVMAVIDFRKTAQKITVDKFFVYIHRVIWFIEQETNGIEFSKFANAAALTNGLQLLYDKIPLFDEPITTNGDFAKYAYDIDTKIDAAATKRTVLVSRLSFFKFTRNDLGLRMDGKHSLVLQINDDLSAVGLQLKATFQGWRY